MSIIKNLKLTNGAFFKILRGGERHLILARKRFQACFELKSSLSKCFAKDYLTLKLFRIWLNGVLSAASASRIFMNRLVRFEYIIIIIMQKKLCMTEGLFSFFLHFSYINSYENKECPK